MTTKPQKAVKTGRKPMVTISIPVITIRKRKPIIMIGGNLFLDLDLSDVQGLKKLIELIQKEVQAVVDTRKQVAYVLSDIYQVLDNVPDVERDEKGKPVLDPGDKLQVIPTPPKDRRLLNQVREAIESALDKLDEKLEKEDKRDEEPEHLPFEIKVKADAAIPFCKRMVWFYEEYIGPGIHVIEAMDLFEDKLDEAEKRWRDYEKGKDEEEESGQAEGEK